MKETMSNEQGRYVRYSESVEIKQENEDEDVKEVRASFRRMREAAYEKHRHAVRDAHAKSHGILKGELQVYDDLPEELKQGLFATAKTYPVIVRYSTSPGDVLPDGVAALRGISKNAEYEIGIQLPTDLDAMPVEDASVEWSEEVSPYRAAAKLTIPPQEAYSPERRVYADDVLTFNPWHCLVEHQPLGSIQRGRKPVYDESSVYRHRMNARQRREPESIDELPD